MVDTFMLMVLSDTTSPLERRRILILAVPLDSREMVLFAAIAGSVRDIFCADARLCHDEAEVLRIRSPAPVADASIRTS